ncbi:MAG: hypothetical protein HY801_03330 [Candidatus Lindowbacteria bacterium]|nr:hypothetical protein [Candidatus Lindowbacteria bacterium]
MRIRKLRVARLLSLRLFGLGVVPPLWFASSFPIRNPNSQIELIRAQPCTSFAKNALSSSLSSLSRIPEISEIRGFLKCFFFLSSSRSSETATAQEI